jgi:hypothetical protein
VSGIVAKESSIGGIYQINTYDECEISEIDDFVQIKQEVSSTDLSEYFSESKQSYFSFI